MKERRICTRISKTVGDVMWKTGEIWAEGEENKLKKVLGQYLPTKIIQKIAAEQGGKRKALKA